MILFVSVVILAGFVLLVARYWEGHQEDQQGRNRGLFVWVGKGMVVPVLVWMLLSSGSMARHPPWKTRAAAATAPGGGGRAPMSLKSMAPAALVVGSHWEAASFGWLVTVVAIQTEA